MKKYIFNIVKLTVTALICYFVYIEFEGSFVAFNKLEKSINWHVFIPSVLMIVIPFVFNAIAWQIIILGLGYRTDLIRAFVIMFLSNSGKYVPGKVWQAFGVIYLAEKSGIPKRISATSFILTQVHAIPVAFLITSLYLMLNSHQIGRYSHKYGIGLMIISLSAITLLVYFPRLIFGVLNGVLKFFKQPAVAIGFGKLRALGILGLYFAVWTTFGLVFICFHFP